MGFDSEVMKISTSNRRQECNLNSKAARQKLIMGNRKLNNVMKENTPKKKSRKELLNDWKKQRAEQKQKGLKKKPLFLVSHCSGFPSLENMPNFGPKNHRFKAPPNMKPIKNFKIEKEMQKKAVQKASLKVPKKIIPHSKSK